ncbi:helix-turn-helix domain-containing protein [Streptomyces sp. NPDC087440]|uniref:MmyB family transcriptional regulator n=1 Tax=Streptomyces sp. NPDC087440 TaxID=3365790 RepID=UPI0038087B97
MDGMDHAPLPGTEGSLGQFLRVRRQRLAPEAAGLPGTARRRVPGLRREEVALLAGVSPDYYGRLEQGREPGASPRVLEALARALLLDDEDRAELFRLARPAARRTKAPPRIERVTPQVRQLLDSLTGTPALLLGHAQDVLAANAPAAALHDDFAQRDNVLRMLFLDPAASTFYRNPERARRCAVAELQKAAAHDPDDRRVRELVGELSMHSGEFRRLWSREGGRTLPNGVVQVRHSAVGELEFRQETLAVRSVPGQQLVVLLAEPGSASADGLALLGSLGAPRP